MSDANTLAQGAAESRRRARATHAPVLHGDTGGISSNEAAKCEAQRASSVGVTPPLLLIRHTRLSIAPGICYGQSDIPLAPTFAVEAAAMRARLPWAPTEIHTSPATRCIRLAEFLGSSVIHHDARLLELNFGEWENRAWESFRSPQSEAWARDPMRNCPPGGETGDEFHRRVGEIHSEILSRTAADSNLRIAVITHAGVIRSWRAHASGRSLMDFFSEPVPHGLPVGAF